MGNSESSYKYRDRRKTYRSEKLEIGKREKEKLKNWIAQSLENAAKAPLQDPQNSEKQKVIFDTDIGTDIDDALALLMLLHLPENDYELLGVTTVYGYTEIRAIVAKAIISAYLSKKGDPKSIPVLVGESQPLGTHREVWHTGTEGLSILSLKEVEKIQKKHKTQSQGHEAAKFIVQQVMAHPHEVILICLGALSNVAVALKMEPKLAQCVKKIVYMGMGHRFTDSQTADFEFKNEQESYEPGFVYFHYPNHNISSDTWAAVQVFESGIPIVVVNDAVTNKLWFGVRPTGDANPDEDDEAKNPCAALMKTSKPAECKVVGGLMHVWLEYRTRALFRKIRGTCPHDALTTAEAIYPGKFVKYARGRVLLHEWAGFGSFVLDPTGPHQIGVLVDRGAFSKWLIPLLVPSYEGRMHTELSRMKSEEFETPAQASEMGPSLIIENEIQEEGKRKLSF